MWRGRRVGGKRKGKGKCENMRAEGNGKMRHGFNGGGGRGRVMRPREEADGEREWMELHPRIT